MNNTVLSKTATSALCCPICESSRIETNSEREQFEYGDGVKKALLSVYIPVHRCIECAYEFVGERAMDLRHEAICRHLRLLTPAEIQEIRLRLGPTQKLFAELCHVGVASIARWEQGQLLQTRSNDVLLRLLAFPENVEKLQQWNAGYDMGAGSKKSNDREFEGFGLDQTAVKQLIPSSQVFSLKRKAG